MPWETVPAASAVMSEELTRLDAWWRAANYLSVGQIYLMDNPLLRVQAARGLGQRRVAGDQVADSACE